jgi:ABC-2 type transport system permease protein
MNNILTIYKREMRSYFVSPVAYIILAVFFLISGFFFYQIVSYTQQASLGGVLGNMAVIFLFLTPFITMRLVAEEKKSGTMELLLTSPITPIQIIIGKFLAAMTIMKICIAGTLVYVLLLLAFSPTGLEWGPLFTGYLGLVFLTSAFVAIGVTASSVSESQIVAGILGFGISFLLLLLNWVGGAGKEFIHTVLRELSPISHYAEFADGIFDIKHIIYFLLWTVLCLSISTKSLEAKLLQ